MLALPVGRYVLSMAKFCVLLFYLLKWCVSLFLTMIPCLAAMWAITVLFEKPLLSVGFNILLVIPGVQGRGEEQYRF